MSRTTLVRRPTMDNGRAGGRRDEKGGGKTGSALAGRKGATARATTSSGKPNKPILDWRDSLE
ncbi:hypothetical protein O9K51_07549 [Purpureocillium lavendulum]|uniref:Uncharacterized protein n=1 Tax=Purpureocillium lavendulum TaxID=1247861 RepID=A0AB34FJV0_9HYPO|nr:hypothetical protein O9K51_07549 [Purpureocillium lavendulum]